MTSYASYLVFVLLITTAVLVSSRPQESTGGTFDLRPSQPMGAFIGEIVVSSSHVAVKPKNKRKKPERTQEEVDGPRFSKFIGGPESEISVSADSAPSLAVASGPSLSISGSTITFNKPAEIVPIGPDN